MLDVGVGAVLYAHNEAAPHITLQVVLGPTLAHTVCLMGTYLLCRWQAHVRMLLLGMPWRACCGWLLGGLLLAAGTFAGLFSGGFSG